MTFSESHTGGAQYLAPSATDFQLHRSARGGMVARVQPTVGGLDALLPPATGYREGFPFLVVFAVGNGFDVYDNSKANLIGTLAAGEAAEIGLVDNSTSDGEWTFRKASVPVFIPYLTGTEWTAVVREVSGEQDWTNYPVTMFIDTASKVSTGGMEADGSDIEFRLEDGTILDFEIVSGMNTASTEFVVVIPSLKRMEWTLLYMFSGDLILGAGGPTITGPHTQPASHQPETDVASYDDAIDPRTAAGGIANNGRWGLETWSSFALLETPYMGAGGYPSPVVQLGSGIPPIDNPSFPSNLAPNETP